VFDVVVVFEDYFLMNPNVALLFFLFLISLVSLKIYITDIVLTME